MPGTQGQIVNLLSCFLLANCPLFFYLYSGLVKHQALFETEDWELHVIPPTYK